MAHRLFSHHDRWLGAQAALALVRHAGDSDVFLPFCDTDEDTLVAAVKGHRLYELDLERLQRIRGLLALLHGPSFDDGVCFEVGYAARLGVPIVGLTTDFQTYGTADGVVGDFPDRLLSVVTTELVRASTLAPPQPEATAHRFVSYSRRNLDALQAALDLAASTLVRLSPSGPAPVHSPSGERLAFIDDLPAREEQIEGVARLLRSKGYVVHYAERQAASAGSEQVAAARRDWEIASHCNLLITDLNGPESPSGSAVLMGAARAQNALSYGLYTSDLRTFASGREPNLRNLMVLYGATAVAQSWTQLHQLLGALPEFDV